MKEDKNNDLFTAEAQDSSNHDGSLNFEDTPMPQENDDVDSISDYDLNKLDRYCKFDKSMPFYKVKLADYI